MQVLIRQFLVTIIRLVLMGSLLLTGCASVGPDFQKPEAPMAESWVEADDSRVKTDTMEYKDWWQVFHDPVLAQLIEKAFEQNLNLQIAGLRIMEARAQLGFAIGTRYPQSQSVNASYTRNKISGDSNSFSTWGSSFDAVWEADIWGKFARGIESADANLAANMLNYDAVLVTLTGDIAASYTDIRTFQERLSYAHSNVRIQKESLRLATTRFELGATSELDVQQARALLKNTQATIPSLELGLGRTKYALSVLLGMPPSDFEAVLEADGKIPDVPDKVVVGIPAELIRRRPDVKAAEMAAAAQCASIGATKADLYPHFSLSGSIGISGDTFSNMTESNSDNFSIMPFISWDIFNYGRIKNNVRAQDALFEQAVVTYQNAVLTAAQEVEDGLLGFLRSQEQVVFLADAVDASKQAANLALEQYREGATDYTRVLNTQTSLLTQQDSLTVSRGQVVANLVSTYKALGGGWQIREGHDYLKSKMKEEMAERTDWGDMLNE
jgi:NodT family efflux transporter outer membrane factor (OMF) lipoprotein